MTVSNTSKWTIIAPIFLVLFSNATGQTMKSKNTHAMDFTKITHQLTVADFEKIKTHILAHGDRKTYRNYDNNNPHYRFKSFDAYLASDIGQRNINNDVKLSSFNSLAVRDEEGQYYTIIIVRKGDIAAMKTWVKKGMEENEVYLTEYYGETSGKMPTQLITCIASIVLELK